MNGHKKRLAAAALAAALLLSAATALAAQGSEDDPLITLSYLEQVFQPKLAAQVDDAVARNAEELQRQLELAVTSYETRVDEALAASGAAALFQSKSLARRETLSLETGHELLLVSGRATALGELMDTTIGAAVAEGESLKAGHLYVVSGAAGGVTAGADCVVMTR